MQPPRRILISRTDSLGDVMLTLPLCGLLKAQDSQCQIVFLCRNYARPIVEACAHIDAILSYDELAGASPELRLQMLRSQAIDVVVHVFPRKDVAQWAKRAGIPLRIGTRSRPYHWTTCNRLPALHRKNSPLHEAQLNVLLAKSLLVDTALPPPAQLGGLFGITPQVPLPEAILAQLDGRPLAVLHPKSAGSAREWPANNYVSLAQQLANNGWQVCVTGTAFEAERLGPHLAALQANALNLMGRLSLAELLALLAHSRALVACSTGPLHIAAALGVRAVGLYPPIRPMHAGRWAALGPDVRILTSEKACSACRKTPEACTCLAAISVEAVLAALPSL